ncbi:Sel1-like protein [Artemisia annua]|uniref:Sel1-like protein n=1 Tax=Artemisia annua TaxID=35608 RepID=A0A2U1L812_ARTAN|nr:Sel1-like protein [Artemisia annua]
MANKITTGFVSNVRTNGRHGSKCDIRAHENTTKRCIRAYQKPENVKEGTGSVTWQAAKKAKADIKGTMEWANEKMKKGTNRYRYKKKLNYGMRLIFVMQLAGGNSTLTLAIFQRIFVMACCFVACVEQVLCFWRRHSVSNVYPLPIGTLLPLRDFKALMPLKLLLTKTSEKVNKDPLCRLDSLEDFDHASQKIECVKKQNHLLKVLKFLIGGEENKEALRKSTGDEYKDFQIVEYQAQKGNTVAMYKIGISYYGLRGVSREHAKALSWFSKAVDKGEPRSLELLGKIYARDAAVTPNYTKAFECKHQNNNIFQL